MPRLVDNDRKTTLTESFLERDTQEVTGLQKLKTVKASLLTPKNRKLRPQFTLDHIDQMVKH